MVRPALLKHLVDRRARFDRLENLLQSALRVDLLGISRDALEVILGRAQHKISRRVEAAVEVNSSHDALESICQGGSPFAPAARLFAASHHEVTAQVQFLRPRLERRARDDPGAKLGHRALAEIRIEAVEVLGDDQLDDRITQKFESLVVEGVVLPLERNARMRHRLSQKKPVAKLVAESSFDRIHDRGGVAAGIAMGHWMPTFVYHEFRDYFKSGALKMV